MVKEVPMMPTDDRSVICPLLSPVSFCMCVAIVLNAFYITIAHTAHSTHDTRSTHGTRR